MFAFWYTPIIFSCRCFIQYNSHSRKQFLSRACSTLLEFFRTYNVQNFPSKYCRLLTTFLLCDLFYFDNVNHKSVQFSIVAYSCYDFISYSMR